jgi:hypothetical protein
LAFPLKSIGYLWAFPVTTVGLLLAAAARLTGGSVGLHHGVIEAHGGLVAWLLRGGRLRQGGAAMTLGHVILARDANCLEASREHERHHVRQFECWGPLLPPLYWGIAAWLRMRGRDPYLDHPLEPPPRT